LVIFETFTQKSCLMTCRTNRNLIKTMKNKLAKITLKVAFLACVAAALVAVPAVSRAENSTNAPAVPAAAKKHALPFHGKVASVDSAAMTFTVGTTMIGITSQTKITKDGQPAVFSDISVGETVRGSYKRDDAGKFIATLVRIGEMKKPSPASTNAPPAQ
jgi:hypothetical protein